MITQIVDYTAEVHVAYEVDVVVSPLCRAPPPTPRIEACVSGDNNLCDAVHPAFTN